MRLSLAAATLLPSSLLRCCLCATQPATTSDVYTFFTPALGVEKELEAIQLWNASWSRQGWTTHVLSLADAKRHPRYKHFLAAFFDLPTANRLEVEIACYMRWVALAATPAGGVLSDYDVLNLHWPAKQPFRETLRPLESHVPSVVIGTRPQFEAAAAYFQQFSVPQDQ
jgi:hypothetical protein